MNLLLDTHTLIRALENHPALSGNARNTIIDGRNMVFVSSVSAWEISIKKAMGKLKAPDNLVEEIKLHRFTRLDMNFDHAKLAGELPDIQIRCKPAQSVVVVFFHMHGVIEMLPVGMDSA